MFRKRFIITFTSIILVLGFLISLMKNNYIFDKIQNTKTTNLDKKVYTSKEYESTIKKYDEKFLILSDESKESKKIESNFNEIIKSMDKSIINENIKNFKGDIKGYKAVIINSERLQEFSYLDELINYSKSGGNLIFAQRPLISDNVKKYSSDLGIESINELVEAENMYVKSNILIKGNGLQRTEDTENSSLDVKLKKGVKVHINADNNIPLLWEEKLGSGKIIFSNGQFLGEKSNRGILTGILYRTGDEFIYPIINSKVLDIDDFPAPMPNGSSDIVYKYYHVNDEKFFINIWWPDIVKMCEEYNAVPTGFLIYNYEDVTNNIENFNGNAYSKNLVTLGRNLLKVGGEIGIHGFNHQPLTTNKYLVGKELGYKPWKSYDEMLKAQIALNKFIHNIYPNYVIRGYVPPSNIITEEGIKALKKGIPSINVISSLYVVGNDELAYEQEFSKGKDGIYNFPRYSSGYDFEEFEKWMIYNGITINGVFSHFIHPDDILDPERNHGMSWEELKKDFEKIMEIVYKDFRWLEVDTISQGVESLDTYLKTKSVFSFEENTIKGYSKDTSKNDYYILRSDKDIIKTKGCSYKKIDEDIYLIHSTNTDFSITTGGK